MATGRNNWPGRGAGTLTVASRTGLVSPTGR